MNSVAKLYAFRSVAVGVMAFAASCVTTHSVVAAEPTPAVDAKPRTAPAASVSEIIVTGSRITRNGFTAPTPTTVMTQEELRLTALPALADVVNQLPQLQGSLSPTIGNGGVSQGLGGLNALNLRGLGAPRTLVLLDGRRVVPASSLAYADIDNLPSQAVKRVDVVTGGASAAYGSDALSGVVNFVLDTKFVGLKGAINGGISDRSDDAERGINLTYGHSFLGDRLHVLLSGEYRKSDGIGGIDTSARSWYQSVKQVPNPAYISRTLTPDIPALISPAHVNIATSAPGGLITSGPLKGTTFGPGGSVSAFQYGTVIGSQMIGGQTGDPLLEQALAATVASSNLFGRVGFDIDANTSVFGQVLSGWSHTPTPGPLPRLGPVFTVRLDNPYLPAAVRAQAVAAGVSTLQLGTSFADIGQLQQNNIRETNQATLGINGRVFNAWKWNAYYQYGQTDLKNQLQNNLNIGTSRNGPLFLSADVITGPNGMPVCRSFATNPTCIPLNLFGTGVISPAAKAYVTGTSQSDSKVAQEVAEASISGEPFTLWAGPISLVAGIGYRRESIKTPFVDSISLSGLAGGWAAANYRPTTGAYDVKEGFAETVIPLAKNQSWAKSLEFDGAVRLTDYSTSGSVTTWKAGITYRPIQDILVRSTISRDIRAPNLNELFAGGTTLNQTNILDPMHGNLLIASVANSLQGNLGLRPEKADALELGVVYQPSWFRRFSISVDYYDTKITDGIATLPVQTLVNDCASGLHPEYCAFVTRGAGLVGGTAFPDTVTRVVSAPVNRAAFDAQGLDFEASYRVNTADFVRGWDASLLVRSLATYNISTTQDTGSGVVHQLAGELGWPNGIEGSVAKLRVNTEFTYTQGPVTVAATWRYIGSGVLATSFFDTSTGPLTVDNNKVAAVSYWDLGVTYRFKSFGSEMELYGRVTNLFGKDPPIIPSTNANAISTNPYFYDPIGRYFRMGIRFQF